MERGLDVVERLRCWIEDRFGAPVTSVGDATSNGKGFDSEIWFVHFAGAGLPDEWRVPLVLRVKPDADRMDIARFEAEVQDWVADQGFPSPRVLAVIEPGPVADRPAQVLERAPGEIVLDALLRAPWRAPSLIRQLARLHARLHQLDPAGFPAGEDLLDKRLRLTRTTVDAIDDQPMRAALAQVERFAPELRDAPGVVCHGDFHPLNVLVDGATMSVIDWTDAGVGDRHGDVARTLLLFEIAAIAAESRFERVLLRVAGPILGRIYRRAYERVLPLDDRRLALWTPVQLLHGWSQARGVQAGTFDRPDGTSAAAGRVDLRLIDGLRRRYEHAVAALD